MAELLRLEDNIPEVISLAFATGREVPSNIQGKPADIMFTLVDGRRTFLPLDAAAQIAHIGVTARQPFEICKMKVGRKTDYRIRLMAEGAAATAPTAITAAPKGTTVNTHQHHNGSNAASYKPATPPAPDAPAALAPQSTKLCAAMCSLIDAMVEAKTYSERRGLDLSTEDLRALVVTAFINDCKGGR
jgi:hypothetical protein